MRGHVTFLSQDDVVGLKISMRDVLRVVEEGFRLKGLGQTEMPPKPGIHPRKDCFIHAMPAHVSGGMEASGVKWVSGYPSNPASGLPYISGLLIMNDPRTGLPVAVMDCAYVTAMRTGASVGLAAKYCARKDSTTVGIVGCGVQARTSLTALVETMPLLSTVKCYDIQPKAMRNYILQMKSQHPKLTFLECSCPPDAAVGSHIIVSATPIVEKPSPLLDAQHLEPGVTVIALDYDATFTSAAMNHCNKFIADDIGQLLETKQHGPYFAGVPPVDRIGDFGHLVCGTKPGRETDTEKLFMMFLGIAVDDMVTGKLVYERALATGTGKTLKLYSRL